LTFSLKSFIVALNHVLTGDASVDVALCVKEDLSPHDVVLLALGDVGGHQVVEILLVLQDLASLIVQFEEVSYVAIAGSFLDHPSFTLCLGLSSFAKSIHHVVALSNFNGEIRLESSLYVNVELSLRNTSDEGLHILSDFARDKVLTRNNLRLLS